MALPARLVEQLKPLREKIWSLPNAVVPVVGSGLSHRLTSWTDLLRGLVTELPEGDQIEAAQLFSAKNYLEIASSVEQLLGRARVGARIEAEYRKPASPRPSSYDALVQLPTQHFITTNYDPWLKDALAARMGTSPRVHCPGDAEAFSDLQQGSSPVVLMVHGDAERPGTCVLGGGGYRKLQYGSPAWKSGMELLVGARCLLFIGYSLSDPDVNALLDDWREVHQAGATRHFLLGTGIGRLRTLTLRERLVEPIDYVDHSLLEELIAHLAERPQGQAEVSNASNFSAYLARLLESVEHISVSGIGSGIGRARTASLHRIEELYTPLSCTMSGARSLEDLSDGGKADPLVELPPQLKAALPQLRAQAKAASLQGPLCDVLPTHRKLLIEGRPGAGKTTFLRLVACMLARDALGIPCPGGGSWSKHYLGIEAEEPLIPIMIRAGSVVGLLEAEARAGQNSGQLLTRALAASCPDTAMIPDRAWHGILQNPDAVLLIDGLDEIADETLRERFFEVLRDAARNFGCRVIVTSRPLETVALLEFGFQRATVAPFGTDEIHAFTNRWAGALHGIAHGLPLTGKVKTYAETLLNAVASVRQVAENPVMLTCLCVVHHNEGELPQGRSRLYRAVMEWLLRSRSAQRLRRGWRDEFARYAFEALAWHMMAGPKGKRSSIDLADAVEAISEELRREYPSEDVEQRHRRGTAWLEFECLGSGIIERIAGSQVRFWHLTFQEYLAAVALSRKRDWWELVEPHVDSLQWRETVDLLPGCLLDGIGRERVDELLNRVLQLALRQGGSLAEKARPMAILSRLRGPVLSSGYKLPRGIESAYASGLAQCVAIFTSAGAKQVSTATRIEVAEALGRAGDPRLVDRVHDLLPVPGFPRLHLGKYPVTVEEYQRFVNDGGYADEGHERWHQSGLALKLNQGWDTPASWETQTEHPNRPVTGISWWEAMAYCAWLSEQGTTTFHLPTEAEWQKAATSRDGPFPWGRRVDAEIANFGGNVGCATPVGVYPAGDGPGGHSDLSGNVLEWCGDELHGSNDRMRPVRGGSWASAPMTLMSKCHDEYHAMLRTDFIGFRVAALI